MKKLLIVSFISASFVLSGCGQATQNNQPANPTPDTTSTVQPITPLHIDSKTGISFVVPDGWVVSTDEENNLYMYKENPYEIVGFKVFPDETSFNKRIAEWDNVIKSGEEIVKTTDEKISGFPIFKLMETSDIYYVKSDSKFYEISLGGKDPEITKIIQSVKLP